MKVEGLGDIMLPFPQTTSPNGSPTKNEDWFPPPGSPELNGREYIRKKVAVGG
jgi:hypothetical protein